MPMRLVHDAARHLHRSSVVSSRLAIIARRRRLTIHHRTVAVVEQAPRHYHRYAVVASCSPATTAIITPPLLLSLQLLHNEKCSFALVARRSYSSSEKEDDDDDASSSRRRPTTSTSITFMTDVEGDAAYFDRFVDHSRVLEFRSTLPSYGRYRYYAHRLSGGQRKNATISDDERGAEWNLGEWDEDYFPYDKEVVFVEEDDDDGDDDETGGGDTTPMLVYGGDVWDKGGADLYVMRQLLSLHRRHPDRVHFLMGNRDINKMRIVDELGTNFDYHRGSRLPRHEGVYWLGGTVCSGLPADKEGNIPSEDDAAERLKWMLRKTMGSVDAFELRRRELERERFAILSGTSVSPCSRSQHSEDDGERTSLTVTDDEVVQSYVRSCDPVNGIMGQYLTRAKLLVRFGPVLFLHGALPFWTKNSNDDQYVHFPTPWVRTEDGTKTACDSLTNWIHALNDFASNQVESWKEFGHVESESRDPTDGVWATEGGYFNNTRGGKMFGALMQYGMGTLPNGSKTQSCVYNSWMHAGLPREDMFGSKDSMEKLSDLFRREGIQIILTGHQPVGDAPWPIQISKNGEERKLWILPCDTSFSGDTRWTSLEGFGSSESKGLGRGTVTSGRGDVAVSEALIRLCSATGSADSLTIHGKLSDGSSYATGNIINTASKEILIGQKLGYAEFTDKESGCLKEGVFWVKAKVGEDALVVSHGKGFDVWNATVKL